MSRKSNDWAWNQKIKPASVKLTLLSMADRTNEEHECWPSYERLEKDTGLNRKTVSKNIQILIDRGLIEDTGKRKGKTGQTRVYRFTFKASQKRNDTKNGTLNKRPKNGMDTSTKNGTLKASQKRYAEPPSLLNHPIEPPKESKQAEPAKSTPTWNAYSIAYLNRYRVSPLRGAKVNKLLCQFVDQVGADNAPAVASYYISLNDQWYQKKGHDVATLLQNAQSIYTQWATGTNNTTQDYRKTERITRSGNDVTEIEAKIRRGEL